MFELITFGGISLRGADGREINALLRHPKQLALLAYLAVEVRPVTRDELIGLFWPAVTEQSARQSLNQAFSGLRSVLGTNAIVTEGTFARRLAPDIVRSDTAAFDAAYAAKLWADVLGSYRGEFLKGFLFSSANEFEDWTTQTRERYRRRAVRAAEARSEQLREAGDVLETALVLAQASEIAPERYDLADAAVDAFADAGQPFAAVEWLERYGRRFEAKLGDPPPPDLVARVDQLRATAPRSVAPATTGREPTAQQPAPAASDSHQTTGAAVPAPPSSIPATRARSRRRSSRRSEAASATAFRQPVRDSSRTRSLRRLPWRRYWPRIGVLATIGVAGAIWLRVRDTSTTERRGLTTMLIRIVDRTPDIGWPHLAESLEETLAARMSNPPRLYVATRPDYPDQTLATRSPVDPTPRAVREEVDFIVAGAVHQTAERIRIDLQVSDGASRRTIRTLRASRPRRDVLAVLDETAEELADTLRPLLGSAIASRMARSRTTSTAAWSDLERSKALLADGRRFAIGGASAQAAALLEIADSLARRAMRVDPHWIDALVQLAQIDRGRSLMRLTPATPDLSAASEHLASATDILSSAASLWPDEVRVHELAGTVSYERWLVARPDYETAHLLEQAIRFLERAILLDPYAARPWVTLSDVRAAQGQHTASAVAAQRALERDVFAEHTNELHNRLFHAYFELRQDEDAARWCDEINRRSPGRSLGAFCELNLQGWSSVREPDLATADSLVGNLDADPPAFAAMMRPRLRMLQAAVAARQGETETARRLLDDAVAAARRTGDAGAASFHAAARVRLGEFDAARRVLAERTRSVGDRVLVKRWFHTLAARSPSEP